MDIDKRERELNRMILEGKALEGFDRFYAEDIVMEEGPDQTFEGKETNRAREEDFFSKVTEVRDFSLKHAAVGAEDDVTMSVWNMDFTHEEWGDVAYEQVAVRHWNDEGLVTRERFFKMD